MSMENAHKTCVCVCMCLTGFVFGFHTDTHIVSESQHSSNELSKTEATTLQPTHTHICTHFQEPKHCASTHAPRFHL